MDSRRNKLFAACVFGAALVGCGGGGGGDSPAPAPAPAPPPPAPTSIESSKVSLTQLPVGCAVNLGCILHASVDVDATGEATVFWSESPLSGTSRLVAANVAASGTAPLSLGTIETNFADPSVRHFTARPLGNRRFAILHQYGANAIPFNEPTRARVVDMATSGAPTAAVAVVLPASLQSMGALPTVVQDPSRQLYGLASGVTVPFPSVPIGAGVSLQTVAVAPLPFAVSERTALGDSASADPRTVYAVGGKVAALDDRHMYSVEVRLADGVPQTPVKVSTQTFAISPAAPFCEAVPGTRIQSAGPGAYVLAWGQPKSIGSGCDLIINGQQVNTGSATVTTFAISAQGGSVVATWQEAAIGTAGSARVLWSRRDAASGAWSAPAPVAPQFSPGSVEQQLFGGAPSQSGTLAVVWSTAGSSQGLISKYVNGTWTTVQGPSAFNVRALGINAEGQGAVIFRNLTCGTASCEELALYRF